jgi:hypothetical protein
MLTENERRYCSDIATRVSTLRIFLNDHTLSDPCEPAAWHAFLSELRTIQGNVSNYCSFIASLLAKQYLQSRFNVDFDAAYKPQGAPGIDIEVWTSERRHIVAEIKTTVPYLGSDFGAQQAVSFKKDFAKLTASTADYKFLFVTDSGAFEVLQKKKYSQLMTGVRIVHLGTGQEHDANC